MLGLFITGTGTEVGKTYVGALIAKQLVEAGVRVGVYKPVASGCLTEGGQIISEDAVMLWEAAGKPGSLDLVCPQRFMAPIAPPLAAREEGKRVDSKKLRTGVEAWRELCDVLLIEGAGGLMSPLSDDDYNADLALDLGVPLLIVAANRLGVMNDTLQTAITATVMIDPSNGHELKVAGVVLNDVSAKGDESCSSNADELARRLGPPLLCSVSWQALPDRVVDWLSLAGQFADESA